MLKAMSPEWRQIAGERGLAAASPNVAHALEKALDGSDLCLEEGLTLAAGEGNDLVALVKVADELRRRAVGDQITYVVNRNLNFTNVWIVGCALCGFSRGPDSPDAYFHSTDALLAKSLEAVERGATEVCIQGGLPKDLDGYYYVQLLRAIKARLPELHVHAYSPMEITYGVEKTRLPLRDYLLMLKEAGLNSIPGTAAEILDDNVRRSLSPNKLKVRQWIEVIRTAHTLGIPSTSTMMYGHTESPEVVRRPNHLDPLANFQFVGTQRSAHIVVENFSGCSRNTVQTSFLQHQQVIAQRETRFFHAVCDFHGRIGMPMKFWQARLDGPKEMDVIISVAILREPALDAHLR